MWNACSRIVDSKDVGPQELVDVLLSLSTLSTGMYGGSTPTPNSLANFEIPQLLQDVVHRFGAEDGLAEVLGPVVVNLLSHPSLFREEGLAASDPQWRGVLTGLEALVSHKQIAIMITKMDDWNPADATAVTFETRSLMGPLLRLNVFSREWVREALPLADTGLNPISSHTLRRCTFLTWNPALVWM